MEPRMVEKRFRTTTVHRALDVLEVKLTNAQMVALIEELGGGPAYDQLPHNERTTPKLRNLLARASRQEPPTFDADGTLLSERLVREAANKLTPRESKLPWQTEALASQTDQAFLNS